MAHGPSSSGTTDVWHACAAMTYNTTRENRALLERHRAQPASLAVQLHQDHWTLNQGSKFLYTSPAAALLEDIRAHRIPVDLLALFDAAGTPFYDGCLVVELQDFRAPIKGEDDRPGGPVSSRHVLRPNTESAHADMRNLAERTEHAWSAAEQLEFEAKVLLATAPPLCLAPDPNIGRMANTMQRISAPRTPPPLRPQKRALESSGADERAAARKTKILQFMDPARSRASKPGPHFWDTIARIRAGEALPADTSADSIETDAGAPPPSQPEADTPAAAPTPVPRPPTAAALSHPTPARSEAGQSSVAGTPVLPARATPQVAALVAAQRQITPRPASVSSNPQPHQPLSNPAYAAAAAAATAQRAPQALPPQAAAIPHVQAPPQMQINPQVWAHYHERARTHIAQMLVRVTPLLGVWVEKKKRGETFPPDQERACVLVAHWTKASTMLRDASQMPDRERGAVVARQANEVLVRLVTTETTIQMRMAQQAAAAAQAAQQQQQHGAAQQQQQQQQQPMQAQLSAAHAQIQAQVQQQVAATAQAAAAAQAQGQAAGQQQITPAQARAMYDLRMQHQQHAQAQAAQSAGASPMFAAAVRAGASPMPQMQVPMPGAGAFAGGGPGGGPPAFNLNAYQTDPQYRASVDQMQKNRQFALYQQQRAAAIAAAQQQQQQMGQGGGPR